tara:strand:+ start:4524 stop:5576 length:1053 start_codon:yes stop_codon:yes gene_type:complete
MNLVLCFGAGKHQEQLLKSAKKIGLNTIVIIRKNEKYKKNLINKVIYGSSYDYKNILKKIKKVSKIDNILYRSSGPAVLSYYKVAKKFNINRLNQDLAKIIYSKNYLFKFLSKKKFSLPLSLNKKEIISQSQKKNFVIKPDAPLIGKKSIFLTSKKSDDSQINNFINKSRIASDNRKVCFSEYISGADLTVFYFKNKNNFAVETVNYIQEFNKFEHKGNLKNYGICSPPIFKDFKYIKLKADSFGRKLLKVFPSYYGFFSLSFKVSSRKLYLYEMNIGLSGDKYVEKIYPVFYKSNPFDIEIINMRGKVLKKIFSNNDNNFVGIFSNGNTEFNKKKYMKKIRYENFKKYF